MRKYLFPALAMGLVLTSCQSDEPFAPGMGEEVQASFTISVPDAMGTRAGEVNSANGGFSNGAGQLSYTVVLLNDANKVMYSETCQSDVNTATFHPTVVQGYTYKVVAYATFGNAVAPSAINEAFDGNDALASIATLKGISDESEDAYYCFNTEVMGGAEMSATLRRPFGKLRLVATDYDKLQALGADVASVKVTYGENVVMETHFNAMAEVFSGQATSKEFEANKATYAEVANELTVFTDYLPASKTGETMYPFTIVTTYTNGETYTRTFAQDIPVKRNYLTTLRGDFFTTEAVLTLTVDEMFAGEENINFVSVSTATQLQDAINNATPGETTEIVLNNDIDLTQPIVFGAPVNPAPAQTRSEEVTVGNFILNLNGKTIENPNGYVVENYSAELTISGNGSLGGNGLGGIRSHGGKLIIEGGNYTCSSNWSNGTYNHILKAENTEVVINGGTFDATVGGTNNAMINVSENSVVTINAGTFKNVNGVIPQFAPYMFTYEKNGELIINGGDFYGGWRFNGETATTDIYGGNFTVSYDGQSFHAASTHVLTIYGGTFSLNNGGKLNPTKHVADGYKAVDNDDNKYYVVSNTVDAVATTFAELKEAVDRGGNIILAENIEMDDILYIAKSVKINGNSKTISSSKNRVIRITTSNIEVEMENLNIVTSAKRVAQNDIRGISVDADLNNVILNLNECKVDFQDESANDWAYGVNITGGSNHVLTIKGGEYEGANVLNIRGNNHIIAVDGTALDSLYKPNINYSGCCIRLDGVESEVCVKNTIFNGSGGNAVAISEASVGANAIKTENNTDNTQQNTGN